MIELTLIGQVTSEPLPQMINDRMSFKYTVTDHTEKGGRVVRTDVVCVRYAGEGEPSPDRGQVLWVRGFPYVGKDGLCLLVNEWQAVKAVMPIGEMVAPQTVGAPVYDAEQISAIKLMQQAGFEVTETKLKV